MSEPEVQYVTVTNPSMVKGPKPCGCGCKGQRHRVKVVMDEWAEDGAGGKKEVPVFWATKMSAGERDRHNASLEEFDKDLGIFVRHPEWDRSHTLAVCLRDHQNHRVWEDLAEARQQLEQFDDDDITKLFVACLQAQQRPRAEGNSGAPSKTTPNDKASGDTQPEPDTSTPTGS